jgi:mRNA interferase RelE/StbE
MKFQVDLDQDARVLVSHLSPGIKRKIKEALRALAHDAYLGKTLQEELEGLRSYRTGRFRIIYQLETAKRRLHVVAIGPRKTIYEELSKSLRKSPITS